MHTHHTQLPLIPRCFLIDLSTSENRITSQPQVPLLSRRPHGDKNAKPASLTVVSPLSATGLWKHLSERKVLVIYRESQVHHLLSHLEKNKNSDYLKFSLGGAFGLSTRKGEYLLGIFQCWDERHALPPPGEHFLYAKKLQDLVFSLTKQPR